MPRIGTLVVEFVATYCLLVGLTALFIWLWKGFQDFGLLLFIGFLFVHLFSAFKVVWAGHTRRLRYGYRRPMPDDRMV